MTIFSNRTFQIAKHKLIHGLLVDTLGRGLARKGLVIRPLYVFKEGLSDREPKDFGSSLRDYEITFFTSEDMKALDCVDGRDVTEVAMRDLINKGAKCLGIKIEGRIAGFTWCRFDTFGHPLENKFTLRENEAYLFDMYVLKAYRGVNLAPLLRYRCYEELTKIGCTALYSYSDVSNAPAIRFKKKLDARVISLWLYIRLGRRFRWHWRLKTYER
jgi:ribosomal protein S18 acetylase RimI-like enzyme